MNLIEFGIEPYQPMNELQQRIARWRHQGLVDDTLLLLEHTPTITLGRRANQDNIVAEPAQLQSEGIDVCHIERGGDVTYHGPGQLVGYPIIHLPSHGLGASDYMHRLEDVVASTLEEYGIATHRRPGVIGVWVGDNKICALGVRIRQGVTFHGFALNLAPNTHHWSLIVPCGIRDGGVTSMASEMRNPPTMSALRDRIATHFCRAFHTTMRRTTVDGIRPEAVADTEPTVAQPVSRRDQQP